MDREKLIELLGTILRDSIINAPHWNVIVDAVKLAEDSPEGQAALIIAAIEWLKKDFFRSAKEHNPVFNIRGN